MPLINDEELGRIGVEVDLFVVGGADLVFGALGFEVFDHREVAGTTQHATQVDDLLDVDVLVLGSIEEFHF